MAQLDGEAGVGQERGDGLGEVTVILNDQDPALRVAHRT